MGLFETETSLECRGITARMYNICVLFVNIYMHNIYVISVNICSVFITACYIKFVYLYTVFMTARVYAICVNIYSEDSRLCILKEYKEYIIVDKFSQPEYRCDKFPIIILVSSWVGFIC